ncbi:MAG TPA: hypothetical protein VHM65_00665, partial [Candidatus Lustribacter sp.]|nr:hypothetical protein [Candidatus Lustribacter sp.]
MTALPPADLPAHEEPPDDDLPEQMRVRRDKRAQLLTAGHAPYPVWVDRTHTLAQVREQWG